MLNEGDIAVVGNYVNEGLGLTTPVMEAFSRIITELKETQKQADSICQTGLPKVEEIISEVIGFNNKRSEHDIAVTAGINECYRIIVRQQQQNAKIVNPARCRTCCNDKCNLLMAVIMIRGMLSKRKVSNEFNSYLFRM